jgi:hypothetical protein
MREPERCVPFSPGSLNLSCLLTDTCTCAKLTPTDTIVYESTSTPSAHYSAQARATSAALKRNQEGNQRVETYLRMPTPRQMARAWYAELLRLATSEVQASNSQAEEQASRISMHVNTILQTCGAHLSVSDRVAPP